MKITKREIIASITIIAIMLLIGVLISTKISEHTMDNNEKYNKATKIKDSELFRYGMDTSVGNAFVYGDLVAVDTVTYPEIKGEYLSVEKVKERYTRHTRRVTTKVNGKSRTRTETYWTWDRVGSEEVHSKRVNFCKIEFNTTQFTIPSREYITTIKQSFSVRYKYYGYASQSKGTIFTALKGGNIEQSGVEIYQNKTISETVDYLESDLGSIIFWVLWVIFMIIVVYGFYALENRWLYN